VNSAIKWLYGIDGCRAGWVVAKAGCDLAELIIDVAPDLRSIFTQAAIDSIVAVDMPIGLAQSQSRACDRAARQLLGWPRARSVFTPPVRAALCADSFTEALRMNREATGTGISKQAFHIIPKIREIDELVSSQTQQYVREVHPEVTFAQLNRGPVIYSKKDVRGRAERIRLLQTAGLKISESFLAHERVRLGRRRVSFDDLIDALACLVTASAIRSGESRSLGRVEEKDAKGLAMEIVCPALGAVYDRPLEFRHLQRPTNVVKGT
jgi:predicted RNase H-like nuclease